MSGNVSLGNIQVLDFSNYPRTIYREDQWKLARPRELLGVADSKQSLLQIEFAMFQQDSLKVENGVTMRLKMSMSSVKIDFLMQPIFRILDLALTQVLGSLTGRLDNPETTVLEEKTTEVRDLNPQFMDLSIEINQPIIKLAVEDEEFVQINLGNIQIKSSNE